MKASRPQSIRGTSTRASQTESPACRPDAPPSPPGPDASPDTPAATTDTDDSTNAPRNRCSPHAPSESTRSTPADAPRPAAGARPATHAPPSRTSDCAPAPTSPTPRSLPRRSEPASVKTLLETNPLPKPFPLLRPTIYRARPCARAWSTGREAKNGVQCKLCNYLLSMGSVGFEKYQVLS